MKERREQHGGTSEIEIVSPLEVRRREREDEQAFGRSKRHRHDKGKRRMTRGQRPPPHGTRGSAWVAKATQAIFLVESPLLLQ